MEFCGGGSMQDIYHGTDFQYFSHNYVVNRKMPHIMFTCTVHTQGSFDC